MRLSGWPGGSAPSRARILPSLFPVSLAPAPGLLPMSTTREQAQVVVWGGGTGGVAAALQAARGGADTLLLTPGAWLGAW